MDYILRRYIDHFTIAPTTKEQQRGYMEYIPWRCIIALPPNLRQRRYFRNMEYILWRYVITLPSHLRQSIYGGDIWSLYYGGIGIKLYIYIHMSEKPFYRLFCSTNKKASGLGKQIVRSKTRTGRKKDSSFKKLLCFKIKTYFSI